MVSRKCSIIGKQVVVILFIEEIIIAPIQPFRNILNLALN